MIKHYSIKIWSLALLLFYAGLENDNVDCRRASWNGNKKNREIVALTFGAIVLSVKDGFKEREEIDYFATDFTRRSTTTRGENGKEGTRVSDLDGESEEEDRIGLSFPFSPDFPLLLPLASDPLPRRIPSSPPWEYTSPVDFYLPSREKATDATAALWASYQPMSNVDSARRDKWYRTIQKV